MRHTRTYCVYIMTNMHRTLYAGVTNNLWRRVREHKEKRNPDSFTSRYDLTQLAYFEEYQYVLDAIASEKQIKGWLRSKKIALIEEMNPEWKDLSMGWYDDTPALSS
jgi:putative endonuclease